MKHTTEEVKDLNKIYENMVVEYTESPYINYKENLEEAFINFSKSYFILRNLWWEGSENGILSGGDEFSEDYPFQSSFDELDVEKWVETSIDSIKEIDPYMFDNEE